MRRSCVWLVSCVLVAETLMLAACGRKTIQNTMPAALSAPASPERDALSGPDAEEQTTRAQRRADVVSRPRRNERSDGIGAAKERSTGLTGSSAQAARPTGTSSVVITQTPTPRAPVADGGWLQGGDTRPTRDRRPIVAAVIVAIGLIAAVLWVPRLTDS